MPTVYERATSQAWETSDSNDAVTLNYYVSDAVGADDAQEAVRQYSPLNIGKRYRSSIRGEPIAQNLWYVDVEYSTSDPTRAIDSADPQQPQAPAANDSLDGSFSLDTTGATVHITQALDTKFTWAANDVFNPNVPNFKGTAPDPSNAIGLSADRVEGTDIYAPALTFTKTVQRANVTMQYINNALYGLVGCVNQAPFYHFAAGEVLYLGCTGNFTQRERWTLTHKFSCQPNETDVVIGNGIKLPYKGGWHYVWCAYEPQKVGDLILQVPVAAYVQQVYPVADFSLLQIGAA